MITVSETATSAGPAVIMAGDYLNKIAGEKIEFECRRRLDEGHSTVVVDFSQTELVNSIGISILLGVIDIAASRGARVKFADMSEQTVELFDMLGLTKHVDVQ